MKLAIDFGNSYLNIAGENSRGEIIRSSIKSVYDDNVVSATGKNVIQVDGEKAIQIGTGNKTFNTSVKVNRIHLKEQLLLAAYKTFGASSNTHYLSLACGVPLEQYKTRPEDIQAFKNDLNALGTIQGTVEGKVISVNVTSCEVFAECYGAIGMMEEVFEKQDGDYILIDIGMHTTDVVNVKIEDGVPVGITQSGTVYTALETLYSELVAIVKARTGIAELSIYKIDDILKQANPVIQGIKGKVNVQEVLETELKNVALELINELNNSFGEIYHNNLIFLGGGASKYLAALGQEKIEQLLFNLKEIPQDLQYYSNVLGYLEMLD